MKFLINRLKNKYLMEEKIKNDDMLSKEEYLIIFDSLVAMLFKRIFNEIQNDLMFNNYLEDYEKLALMIMELDLKEIKCHKETIIDSFTLIQEYLYNEKENEISVADEMIKDIQQSVEIQYSILKNKLNLGLSKEEIKEQSIKRFEILYNEKIS